MKKSEMLESIHNWYWNNHPKFRPADLLDLLEREGMLPPLAEFKTVVDRSTEDEEIKRTVYIQEHKWEEEDEKK